MSERFFAFDDRRSVLVNHGDAIIASGARELLFDEMVERMFVPFCRILSDLMDMDGRITDVHKDESWVREAKEELLSAAMDSAAPLREERPDGQVEAVIHTAAGDTYRIVGTMTEDR